MVSTSECLQSSCCCRAALSGLQLVVAKLAWLPAELYWQPSLTCAKSSQRIQNMPVSGSRKQQLTHSYTLADLSQVLPAGGA